LDGPFVAMILFLIKVDDFDPLKAYLSDEVAQEYFGA
jgi:hypothetical protein